MAEQMQHFENPLISFLIRPLTLFRPYYKNELMIMDFSLYCNLQKNSFIYRSPKTKFSCHYTTKDLMFDNMSVFLASHIVGLPENIRLGLSDHILSTNSEIKINRNNLRNFITAVMMDNVDENTCPEIFFSF